MAVEHAAARGDMDIIKAIVEHVLDLFTHRSSVAAADAPYVSQLAYENAALGGHLSVIEYLDSAFGPLRAVARTIKAAVTGGNLQVLQSLLRRDHEGILRVIVS